MHINRNMSAVIANNQLLRTENKLSKSMERLSSGLKINQASDNPSGIAISNKMKAQIDALDQADRNASDGISVLQIADGALNEVASILQRMRELSVQAANGTNAYEDRLSIQEEIDELKKEVDRISRDTEYNTKSLLDGSSDVRIYGENATRFSASDSVIAQVYKLNVTEAATQATVEFPAEKPEKAGNITINGVTASITEDMDNEAYLQEIRNAAAKAGCVVDMSEDGSSILVKSAYYGFDESIECTVDAEMADAMPASAYNANKKLNEDGTYTIANTGKDAAVSIPGSGSSETRLATGFTSTTTVEAQGNRIFITDNNGFSIEFLLDADYVETPGTTEGNFEIEVTEIGSLTIQIGANEHQDMDVRIGEISTESLYVDTVDVAVEKGAERAMLTLDEAISDLSAARSRIGAFQNRLEYAANSLSATEENMTAAYSTILDTDMAEEMTEYTQQNILSQAAISVLSQANELPQQVLSLLQ